MKPGSVSSFVPAYTATLFSLGFALPSTEVKLPLAPVEESKTPKPLPPLPLLTPRNVYILFAREPGLVVNAYYRGKDGSYFTDRAREFCIGLQQAGAPQPVWDAIDACWTGHAPHDIHELQPVFDAVVAIFHGASRAVTGTHEVSDLARPPEALKVG